MPIVGQIFTRPEAQREALRVALVAGTLGRGGAEKQLTYMAKSLLAAGVSVRVYSATRGEAYESTLRAMGIPVYWFGRFQNPVFRLATILRLLRAYRPHIIQSSHSYVNLYAAAAGWRLNSVSLGAQRGNWRVSWDGNGLWSYPLMRAPSAVVANSQAAAEELTARGIVRPERMHVLPNAIDVDVYSNASINAGSPPYRGPVVIVVSRLIGCKRIDRFLRAFSLAHRQAPSLKGIVVGDGPEREGLERLARELGLSSQVEFVGERDDVPSLLQTARLLVLSSDDEGTPNVVLEAMASGLPVVATPAGGVTDLVADGSTGYLVDFDDTAAMANHMAELSASPELCRRLGAAGREHVRQRHGLASLSKRLLNIYCDIARRRNDRQVLQAASGIG